MKEEIILKKENKQSLTYEELDYFFNGYLNNKISDSDMTKLLKAICKNNLNMREINDLCDIFINSGEVLTQDFDNTVDKHSTGGVGDKTTLVIAPIVACLGVKFPKMSGRSLGFTGGTIDKLESIGVNTNLTDKEFKQEVKDLGFAIMSQTKNICPMDKKVYALRDITNTTENVGLIATSIMSKKIACGSKTIIIDLKVGQGALIKTFREARHLAKVMAKIGKKYNRRVLCVLTDMNAPLGNNIGNKLEVQEAIDVLQNKVHNNFYRLCVFLSTIIVCLSLKMPILTARKKVLEVIKDGKAYDKFVSFVKYQGGSLDNLEIKAKPTPIYAKDSGFVKSIDAKNLGFLSHDLGGGRKKLNDKINYDAGIILNKHIGDYVKKGELLCTLYGKKVDTDIVPSYFKLSKNIVFPKRIIISIIR